jgi:hypothetical protein
MAAQRNRRVPQLDERVTLRLVLPASTEEWAEDDLGEYDCERTSEGLVIADEIGGNCNAVENAASFLRDLADAFAECGVSPMEFTLTARSDA